DRASEPGCGRARRDARLARAARARGLEVLHAVRPGHEGVADRRLVSRRRRGRLPVPRASARARPARRRRAQGPRRADPPTVAPGGGAPPPRAGPSPEQSLAAASPRDIGPAAAAFPDIAFVVYHSGYERDPDGTEGPYD